MLLNNREKEKPLFSPTHVCQLRAINSSLRVILLSYSSDVLLRTFDLAWLEHFFSLYISI